MSELDLQNADTSSVTEMTGMFFGAELFDQEIGGWDTSSVSIILGMLGMLEGAESFNRDISGRCVGQIHSKPPSFNDGAGFERDDAKQHNWGEPC